MTMADKDRPDVLAHRQFEAERREFDGLNLAQRFQRIYDTNLWGADTSISGLGSEESVAAAFRDRLTILLKKLQIVTLLDAPCGDANWITRADMHGIRYIGVDIVPDLIARLQAKKAGPVEYIVADITTDPLPAADAILCRDCLVHLSFENIARAVENFRNSGARWLVTTHFPEWIQNRDCEDGDWRALNLNCAPFEWGQPYALINEGCQEASGGWTDKSLGVWRIADIPTMSE